MTNAPRRCPACTAELPPDAPQGACPKCLLAAGFESADGDPRDDVPERADVESRFPDMEILEVLGRGGMGIVFKARQKSLDRLVALKVLPRAVADDAGDAGRFEERFTREARALARLSHRNIVGVHEFGERDGLYFFVMEYVDGANLRQVMQGDGISPKQALAVVPQICDALQYAHDQGVVHRDIKPENVLLDRDGLVKIADFGLAKLVIRSNDDRTLTRQGLVMGTPHYMAPEQFEQPGEVDHRADIYSLGVVLYEMLTGELPIGRFRKPSEKVQVDVRLDEVVLRSLEKERDRRYQHVSEVKTSIGNVADAGSGAAVAPRASGATGAAQFPPHPHRPDRKRYSKLAFWGFLATPITALFGGLIMGLAWLLLDADGTDRNADVGMGLVMALGTVVALGLLTAVGLSIAALIGISRSDGEKHGVGLAVIGLLLPFLCCLPVSASALFVGSSATAPAVVRSAPADATWPSAQPPSPPNAQPPSPPNAQPPSPRSAQPDSPRSAQPDSPRSAQPDSPPIVPPR